MKTISVLGTGCMGKALVPLLQPHFDQVCWGSRTPDNTPGTVSYEEALRADVIIHTLWFRDVIPWALQNEEALAGKILVDIANPFTEDFSDFTLEWGTSAAEELQKVLPQTRVVGAFKNTFFKVLEQPLHNGQRSDVYVTGDDESARLQVIQLLQPLPFRVLDGGLLANNRTIERMTLFSREMAIRYGHYPYVSYRIFGLE